MRETIYLLLGSNMGNSLLTLEAALARIGKLGSIHKTSAYYKTKAWGNISQPDFINQVIALQTIMTPIDLMTALQQIEKDLGRVRGEKWGPRLIDIDILFYGERIIKEANLEIPHPRIVQRRFTLVPLVEIASDFLHPVTLKTMVELLAQCSDGLEVARI